VVKKLKPCLDPRVIRRWGSLTGYPSLPLTRNVYDVRSLAGQFDAKPAEIRRLLRGDLDPVRSREFIDEMRAPGLPT
jgi:hypothetical protein